MNKFVACLVLIIVSVVFGATAEIRAKRAINPFLDSMGKRAINPFLDSMGKRSYRVVSLPEKRYFDSLAGQSLGKRSAFEEYYQ
ncbi:unnamed protein product [Caenorhabditis angaria]|uniref:Uncharacterized protein n=1 Tax=Caenorhabditis angaria TaxID=860376 RepID=A0A9P1J1Z5_9PELO|nr:unnamed protein product [Caenorhabditis angaria]